MSALRYSPRSSAPSARPWKPDVPQLSDLRRGSSGRLEFAIAYQRGLEALGDPR